MTASLRVVAHCWDTPALAEVGGSGTPGGLKPSLPATPSRMPGKKLASRGYSLLVLLGLGGTPPPQQVQES